MSPSSAPWSSACAGQPLLWAPSSPDGRSLPRISPASCLAGPHALHEATQLPARQQPPGCRDQRLILRTNPAKKAWSDLLGKKGQAHGLTGAEGPAGDPPPAAGLPGDGPRRAAAERLGCSGGSGLPAVRRSPPRSVSGAGERGCRVPGSGKQLWCITCCLWWCPEPDLVPPQCLLTQSLTRAGASAWGIGAGLGYLRAAGAVDTPVRQAASSPQPMQVNECGCRSRVA